MATARSLSGLNWIVRTYGTALLATLGRTTDSSRFTVNITSNTRMNSARTALATIETACWTDFAGQRQTWDAAWAAASARIFDQIVAGCPVPVTEILNDPDTNARLALKAACRALELCACRFVANGGTL